MVWIRSKVQDEASVKVAGTIHRSDVVMILVDNTRWSDRCFFGAKDLAKDWMDSNRLDTQIYIMI